MYMRQPRSTVRRVAVVIFKARKESKQQQQKKKSDTTKQLTFATWELFHKMQVCGRHFVAIIWRHFFSYNMRLFQVANVHLFTRNWHMRRRDYYHTISTCTYLLWMARLKCLFAVSHTLWRSVSRWISFCKIRLKWQKKVVRPRNTKRFFKYLKKTRE